MMEQYYEHRAADGTAGVLEWNKNIKETERLTTLPLRCGEWARDIETFNMKIITLNFSHILHANHNLDLQSRQNKLFNINDA